jgi:hypothetical protein
VKGNKTKIVNFMVLEGGAKTTQIDQFSKIFSTAAHVEEKLIAW